jgi:hypothetical protein
VRQRELQKLDLEIAHLREPWWRRPAYLGSLLPVILGIATLGIGFWTGYFDTQRSLIEVRTEKLRLEEERLTERSDSLRSDFRRRQDSLAAVVTDERLSARREIARNDSIREAERAKTAQEILRLNRTKAQERATLEKALSQVQAQVREEQSKAKRLPVEAHVQVLTSDRRQGGVDPAHPSVTRLIKLLLEEGPRYVGTVTAALTKNQGDPVLKALFMYILYHGTRDTQWRDSLLALGDRIAGTSTEAGFDEGFWMIFGASHWGVVDRPRIYEHALQWIERDPGLVGRSGAHIFHSRDSVPSLATAQTDLYLGAIAKARDAALSSKSSFYLDRLFPIRVLDTLEPAAATVVLGTIIADSASAEFRDALLLGTAEPSGEFARMRQYFRREEPLNFYSQADWLRWLNEHGDVVSMWLEPTLSRAHNAIQAQAPP